MKSNAKLNSVLSTSHEELKSLNDASCPQAENNEIEKSYFLSFMDTPITERIVFNHVKSGPVNEEISFTPREYLTGGGQWGDISEATFEWTKNILNQDTPMEALKNLRDDLHDHLEKLNIVIRLFGYYTAANPEF